MKLLTKEIRKSLPVLGTHESKEAKDVPIVVKFFTPTSNWTWYATEASCILKDGTSIGLTFIDETPNAWDEIEDVIFFGLVRGFEAELGNFSYNELKSVKGPFGLGVERDMYFGKHTLAEAQERQL